MKVLIIPMLLLCLSVATKAQQYGPKDSNNEYKNFTNSDEKDYRFGNVLNPVMNAIRIDDASIKLDGFLDESIWNKAPIATGFTQTNPVDGGTPSQKTEARILYNNKYIFVGIMAYESAPDSVNGPLFRKDGRDQSDWVYVSFDSYNDNRTAFSFAVNPKGVRKDIMYFDDRGEDLLWDAVWEAEVEMLNNGWSVEIKIPLSQLRFSSKNTVQSWGVNFQRRIARNQEVNFWAPTPRSEAGFVSQFGTLNGIQDLDEPTRLEITPYVSSKLERAPDNSANPYYEENAFDGNIGGDIKYGLTSDLTLTATLNPDFGQVEADPASINLSQFEQFFEERRPFFLEGNDIFRFGSTKNFNNVGNPNTFYSRRIGRAPQGNINRANNFNNQSLYNPNATNELYTDTPSQTKILGAAKLSGKTQSGLSIGTLYARTVEQKSPYTAYLNDGTQTSGDYTIQPSSNFLVTRLKQDFNSGNTVVGGFFSGMNRDIENTYFEEYLHNAAFISGADFEHAWKDRTWIISGSASVSSVFGSTSAITRTQQAPQRYYQRVDSDFLSVDTTRTSLSGIASELSFQKSSGKHWRWSITGSLVTPGYETNDIGFQNRADYKAVATGIRYEESNPTFFQFYEIWGNTVHGWNFDNEINAHAYNTGGYFRFKNLWSFNVNTNANLDVYSDRIMRGGPNFKMPGSLNFNFNVNSNQTKKFSGGLGQFHRTDRVGEYDHYYWVNFMFRPTTFIQISVAPEIGLQNDVDQFVQTRQRGANAIDNDVTYGNRYIFSDIKMTDLSTEFRLNWTFNTKMSLQTYVRPYIATGKYSNLKEFNNPGGFGFDVYGVDKGSVVKNVDGSQTVDPDGAGGEGAFNVRPLDFNVKSLQGNAVFRWEYRPGSTLFLVWQQQRSGFSRQGEFDFGRDFGNVFKPEPTNVFLVKLSYWFGN